jgi:hypothetical protein
MHSDYHRENLTPAISWRCGDARSRPASWGLTSGGELLERPA